MCRIQTLASVASRSGEAWLEGRHPRDARYASIRSPEVQNSGSVCFAPVRALARILWAKSEHDDDWWEEMRSLQSRELAPPVFIYGRQRLTCSRSVVDRKTLNQEQLEYFARLSMTLANYVGEDFVTSFSSTDDLLDFCCAVCAIQSERNACGD